MRNVTLPASLFMALLGAAACSGGTHGFGTFDDGGTGDPDSASGNDSGILPSGDSGNLFNPDASTTPDTGTVTVSTTIYAHTDDTLYTMDPQTKAVTVIGKFAGLGGGAGDTTVTDLAVNGNNDVYVNSETVIYKATVPASPGTVNLTKVASITVGTGQKFFALAFAPAGVLGAGETLIGGDGTGEVFSIDTATGTTKHLGNFGPDNSVSGNIFALSGDFVFYTDANNKPTGLATIRSCKAGGASCSKTSDYLAGIDMTALATAYSSGTPATSLLSGIYGGSSAGPGPGTGFGDVFGLGAWQGDVYGFSRNLTGTTPSPPHLIAIDTTSGKGAIVPGAYSFTNGWSGAGVTTKVTVHVPPPPPPPK